MGIQFRFDPDRRGEGPDRDPSAPGQGQKGGAYPRELPGDEGSRGGQGANRFDPAGPFTGGLRAGSEPVYRRIWPQGAFKSEASRCWRRLRAVAKAFGGEELPGPLNPWGVVDVK